jgi:hypothetical protein
MGLSRVRCAFPGPRWSHESATDCVTVSTLSFMLTKRSVDSNRSDSSTRALPRPICCRTSHNLRKEDKQGLLPKVIAVSFLGSSTFPRECLSAGTALFIGCRGPIWRISGHIGRQSGSHKGNAAPNIAIFPVQHCGALRTPILCKAVFGHCLSRSPRFSNTNDKYNALPHYVLILKDGVHLLRNAQCVKKRRQAYHT